MIEANTSVPFIVKVFALVKSATAADTGTLGTLIERVKANTRIRLKSFLVNFISISSFLLWGYETIFESPCVSNYGGQLALKDSFIPCKCVGCYK